MKTSKRQTFILNFCVGMVWDEPDRPTNRNNPTRKVGAWRYIALKYTVWCPLFADRLAQFCIGKGSSGVLRGHEHFHPKPESWADSDLILYSLYIDPSLFQ